jgi:peptidoglycan/xylan/chitin deacetylase (PgdA/CDA1 family)
VCDGGGSKWRRAKREFRRSGLLGFIDVLLFRIYYFFFLSAHDRVWETNQLAAIEQRYPPVSANLPVLFTDNPNSPEAKEFIIDSGCDLMIARCKVLLKKSIFHIPKMGTVVMHPGICPEYRNAHGCFWALAKRDLDKVGMTLLQVDEGVDTGPVYAYYRAEYDETKESHTLIQNRVVFDNLQAMQSKLLAIGKGEAKPITTVGRASNVWGQPRLTAYLYWKWCARTQRKLGQGRGVLLYHDVIAGEGFDSSGFVGADANIYKLDVALFEAHLKALRAAFPNGPMLMKVGSRFFEQTPFMLTFDDGGESFINEIAGRLEAFGWFGHFFITTGRIGTKGFLSKAQIRDLRRRGHAIGSHSVSHPLMMSALAYNEIFKEWRDSVATLADLLGEPIEIASVPGGYCSKKVIGAAAAAGVRFLLTSEPTPRLSRMGPVQLIGRYAMQRTTTPQEAVALAGYVQSIQFRHWLRWRGLELMKRGLGRSYPVLRKRILAYKETRLQRADI